MQGLWCSSVLPPPHPPPSQILTKGFSPGACESGLPVLGWMQPRISLNPPPPPLLWIHNRTVLTANSSLQHPPPLLPLPHPLPPPSPPVCGLDSWRTTDALYVHFSVLCCFDGIPQVPSVLLQQVSAVMCIWNTLSTTHRPYCLFLSLQHEIL